MSDHTPTTQQVEDGFAHEPEYEYSNPIGYGAHVQSSRRAFRRWLAEVEWAAAEKALTDLADELSLPRKLWHGDSGVEVMVDERTMEMQKLTEWLRARAEAYRREGKE